MTPRPLAVALAVAVVALLHARHAARRREAVAFAAGAYAGADAVGRVHAGDIGARAE